MLGVGQQRKLQEVNQHHDVLLHARRCLWADIGHGLGLHPAQRPDAARRGTCCHGFLLYHFELALAACLCQSRHTQDPHAAVVVTGRAAGDSVPC